MLKSLKSRIVHIKKESHKIHLLHLINSLIVGGAEVALLHYIQALGREDYEHHVYSFGNDGPIMGFSGEAVPGVHILKRPFV